MTSLNTDLRCYQVKIYGRLDEDFLASYCPPETTLRVEGELTILSNICTDPSGILGLIRTLHNLGFILQSLNS